MNTPDRKWYDPPEPEPKRTIEDWLTIVTFFAAAIIGVFLVLAALG